MISNQGQKSFKGEKTKWEPVEVWHFYEKKFFKKPDLFASGTAAVNGKMTQGTDN